MDWSISDRAELLALKNSIDSDDIKVKEQIKKVLLDNKYIIHVLHNKDLEKSDAEVDDYFGVNIFPYYMIEPTQHSSENFVCYEVSYDELNRYNKVVKVLKIIFYVLCEQKNLIDAETGVARHDMLAALIQDQFNYTNFFGSTIKLVSDVPSVVDSSYACRTLIFEQTTDNNVVKTKGGIAKISNKDIVTFA